MKRHILTLLTICILATPLYANLTLSGQTGLIEMPTAEILQYKENNMAYDIGKIGTTDISRYKVNLGAFKNWEFGFVGGAVPTEGVFINAKYSIMADNERFPLMLAVGFSNLTSRDLTTLYLVASKAFQNGIHAHLGFEAEFTSHEINPVIMAGLEYWVNPQFSVLGDVIGAKTQFRTNLGVRYAMNPQFSIRASWLDLTSGTRSGYTLGISFGQFL